MSRRQRMLDAQREEAQAKLAEQQRQSQERRSTSISAGISALSDRAEAIEMVDQADARVGSAVRGVYSENTSVDEVEAIFAAYGITESDVRRYLSVTTVAKQAAVESDRQPYSER